MHVQGVDLCWGEERDLGGLLAGPYLATDDPAGEYGVPADQRSRYGRQAVRDRQAALALGSGWPSTTPGRTTGTRSSGSPARTTAWLMPSSGPAPSPSAPGMAQSGSAPNAESAQPRST